MVQQESTEKYVCGSCCHCIMDDGEPYCVMKDLYTSVAPEDVCDEKNIRGEYYWTKRTDDDARH